jgi:hydroxyacyl-ACP dehydratase HTD2-like protein with hotdog domain
MLLLARTTPREQSAKKTDGMLAFILDMSEARQAGLAIRPIRTMMNHAISEVFIDHVRIPAESLIGWSVITSIVDNTGSSGPLGLVMLQHRFATARGLVIEATQTIVYQDQAPKDEPPARPITVQDAVGAEMSADPILSFSFSAVIFNSHRIHYDPNYARNVEGYPSLVVQGPVETELLMNVAAGAGNAAPFQFFGSQSVDLRR